MVLIFIYEFFGLVVFEVLIFGILVICSDCGVFRELVLLDVGFICGKLNEYIVVVERFNEILFWVCWEKVMIDFYYLIMVVNYFKEYEKEILVIKN